MAAKKSAVPLRSRRAKRTPGRASKVLPYPQRVKFWQAGLSTLSIVLLGFVVWGWALASSAAPPVANDGSSLTLAPTLHYSPLRGQYSIQLTWSVDAGSGQDGRYVVLRNNEPLGSTQTNSFRDYTVHPEVTYTYQVRALTGTEDVRSQSMAHEVTIHCAWLTCQLN